MTSRETKTVQQISTNQALMKQNQDNFAVAIEEIFKRLDKQDRSLDKINKKFDELTGAKQVLLKLTAVVAFCITIAATYLGIHHK